MKCFGNSNCKVLALPTDHRMIYWRVWRECVCRCECWKYSAPSEPQTDYACQWNRKLKGDRRQAVPKRLVAYGTIIWPGSGSHTPQGWAARLSSTRRFEIRRHDADTQNPGLGGFVWPWAQGLAWEYCRFTYERKIKETFISVVMTSVDYVKTNYSSQEVEHCRVGVRGHANKIWTFVSLASSTGCIFGKRRLWVFAQKLSV